jgi:hypothetical protein
MWTGQVGPAIDVDHDKCNCKPGRSSSNAGGVLTRHIKLATAPLLAPWWNRGEN